MKIFTSDLHFHHKRIVEFTNRGSECLSQDAHDKWLVNLWNLEVSSGDIVYHIGDFSFAKNYDDIADIVYKLKGQKIFIKGNHDRREHFDRLVEDKLIEAWYDYKEIKLNDMKVVLFHYPIASWNSQSYGSWHLHGHCHGNFKDSNGKMLDVGLDSSYNIFGRHMFIDEHQISQIMNERELYLADQHRKDLT